MKKNFFLALVCIFGLGSSIIAQEAAAPAADAQPVVVEETTCTLPSVSLALEWRTSYVSKGKIINPDPIVAADLFVEWQGLYVEFWAAFDMSDYNSFGRSPYGNDRKYRAEEVDYTIGYGYTFDDLLGDFSPVSFDVNWTYYQYPRYRDGRSHFHETPFTLTVKLDNVLQSFVAEDSKHALGIGAKTTYDLTHYYWYGQAFAEYSYALCDKTSISVSNNWYWGDQNFNSFNSRALNATDLRVDVKYALCDNVTLGAYVAGGWAIDQQNRKAWKADPNNNNANFWGGLNCSYSF